LNLFVSDEEWDLWLNNKKLWRERLDSFAFQKPKENTTNTQE
jgi:hypothetical protein